MAELAAKSAIEVTADSQASNCSPAVAAERRPGGEPGAFCCPNKLLTMSFKGKVEAVQRETQSPELARLFAVYDAFVEGRLECIPEYFDAHGFYRTSGVFPGMRERYLGHEEIREFWHAATEPWESLQIETGRTMARGADVVAQIWLTGRGRHSRVEVRGVEAGHLVRFRDLKIVEFLAFASWDLAIEHLDGPAG